MVFCQIASQMKKDSRLSKNVQSNERTSRTDRTCLDLKIKEQSCCSEKVRSIKWKGNTHTGGMAAKEKRWKQSEQWEVEEEVT